MSVVECRPAVPVDWSPQQHDYYKNDFQNAVRRNLHIWVKWRTRLNDNLVDAVMTGSEVDDVEPLRQCMNRDAPDPDHPTSNPKTLMTFSASSNSSTNLHTKDFYKFGIPRAKVDPRIQAASRHGPTDAETNGKPSESTIPTIVVNGVDGSSFRHLDDDDGFVMDYFNYQDTPSTKSSAASSPNAVRFHRSAATLPVAPAPEVPKDRRTERSKKSEERRRFPPSYLEPFVGSRMIKARRDRDGMYTRSAYHLDEL